LFWHAIIPTYEYFILHFIMLSSHNTSINFSKKLLFFLANHVIFASIIVKLDFITLLHCNTHITFQKISLIFLANYVIPMSILLNYFLQHCHIAIPTLHFQNFHHFFGLEIIIIMQYPHMGPKMSTIASTNYVIFIYLHVLPI
jgi:hypothetical protein